MIHHKNYKLSSLVMCVRCWNRSHIAHELYEEYNSIQAPPTAVREDTPRTAPVAHTNEYPVVYSHGSF